MKNTQRMNTLWILGFCAALTIGFMLKGCERDQGNPTAPRQGVTLKFAGSPEWQAKATGLTVKAEGLNDQNNPNGQDVVQQTVTQLTFPVEVPLMLYKPPCRWRITAAFTLTRDAPISAQGDLDVCTGNVVELHLDPFEPFRIESGDNPIQAPLSAQMGETITVSCGPIAISAPDSDLYPVSAVLSEQGGQSVNGPIHANAAVSGEFPDPYPLSSAVTERMFTCTIRDGRSPDQTFAKSIQRIVPTPTPTVTPTVTPTPTPDPCQVKNQNDSGPDSLRAILDSLACSTISFVPAVQGQTITLTTGHLTVANSMTIDGGSGVTISGNNSSRVFWVKIGFDVTFAGLTITQGRATGGSCPDGCGGGIYNQYGTVTITNDSAVSDNMADHIGGGIYTFGMLTVNGTIIGNTAIAGGGLYGAGDQAEITINGTGRIRNNTATSNGGGIFMSSVLTVTGANSITVCGNTNAMCANYFQWPGICALPAAPCP